MKITAFIVVTSVISGCVSSGRSTVSKWLPLQRARDLACENWPVPSNDLSIEDIRLAPGDSTAFLVTSRGRTGNLRHYWLPFADEDIDLDAELYLPLSIGREALPVTGQVQNHQGILALAQSRAANVELELRSAKSNIVLGKQQLAQGGLEDTQVYAAKRGALMAFKLDSGAYHFAYWPRGAKSAQILAFKFNDWPQMVVDEQGGRAVAMLRQGDQILLQTSKLAGGTVAESSFALALNQEVESWTPYSVSGKIGVIAVVGDTLVGQAELRRGELVPGESKVRWSPAYPLGDAHTTEPMVDVLGGVPVAYLGQWLDEETTLARYAGATAGIGKAQYFGVFPKGTRIAQVFHGQDQEDIFLALRHKSDEQWSFRLCKL